MTHYLIYKITNNINGKIYIGKHKTNNVDDGYMGSGKRLWLAYRKYGMENFTKEILYDVEDAELMDFLEELIVDEEFVKREDTYNLKVGGEGGSMKGRPSWNKGKHPSDETRRKMSNAKKGKPAWNKGKTGFVSPRKGKHLSEETKKKLSESHKGKGHPWSKGKPSHNKGKPMSEEQKRKISEANKGKPGHPKSEETKKKISETLRKRHLESQRIKICG